MESFFAELEEKRFRAQQTFKWIHQLGVVDFESMTNIPRDLRLRLSEIARVHPPAVEDEQLSCDGTRKWLLGVEGGSSVETVFIPEPGRGTLCVSSQAGCALNCAFCSTARQGFNRNLDASEIVGQLWLAAKRLVARADVSSRRDRITNVVLMGMGEPLLNFDAVTEAIDIMLDDCAYGLSRRRVTLSTAGLVPGIDRLAERAPVSLAVSLHATTDTLRDRLVPVNRKYPLATLLDACRRYARVNPKGRITFEYVMLAGVNDAVEDAERLVALVANVPAKINLIPFNPFPGAPFQRSQPQHIQRFREKLQSAGLLTTTRRPRGDDIDAACGQLAGRILPRPRRATGRRNA